MYESKMILNTRCIPSITYIYINMYIYLSVVLTAHKAKKTAITPQSIFENSLILLWAPPSYSEKIEEDWVTVCISLTIVSTLLEDALAVEYVG